MYNIFRNFIWWAQSITVGSILDLLFGKSFQTTMQIGHGNTLFRSELND